MEWKPPHPRQTYYPGNNKRTHRTVGRDVAAPPSRRNVISHIIIIIITVSDGTYGFILFINFFFFYYSFQSTIVITVTTIERYYFILPWRHRSFSSPRRGWAPVSIGPDARGLVTWRPRQRDRGGSRSRSSRVRSLRGSAGVRAADTAGAPKYFGRNFEHTLSVTLVPERRDCLIATMTAREEITRRRRVTFFLSARRVFDNDNMICGEGRRSNAASTRVIHGLVLLLCPSRERAVRPIWPESGM